MSAPAGHFASRIRTEREPAGLGPRRIKVSIEGNRFSRAAPQVPVQFVRHRLGWQGAKPGAGVIVADDPSHFANGSGPNELAPDVVLHLRTLLAAALENTLILARGLDHQPALMDGQGHRLFGIDILARLARVNANQRPPVLGRGGDNRINVFAFQQFAVVLVHLGPVHGGRRPGAFEIDVGHSHDPGFRRLAGRPQQTPSLAAGADNGNPNSVVGSGPPRRGQHSGRDEHRRDAGGNSTHSDTAQKLAARQPFS